MIKAIRAENIYNLVNWFSSVNSICTLFSQKPDDNATPAWSYAFIQTVSDNTRTKTQQWYITKTARVSFTIVCKKVLWATDTPERVLRDISDAITNAIVYQWCDNKIDNVDGFITQSILEDTVSPIFFADNRHFIVKDYIFNYISVE